MYTDNIHDNSITPTNNSATSLLFYELRASQENIESADRKKSSLSSKSYKELKYLLPDKSKIKEIDIVDKINECDENDRHIII